MKYFSYKAIDETGVIRRGSMSALNPKDLDARLVRADLQLISSRSSYFSRIRGNQQWSRRELLDFTFHLEQLVSAGVPLIEALCEYRDAAERPHLQGVAGQVIDSIESGSSLSESCAEQPVIFNSLYISMLDVGEQSGRLDKVLADLGELLKWHDETVSRIKNVLIYPSFVAVVLLLVIVFVMTWLVPGLMTFVVSTGNELPWHTAALVATSGFVSSYWVWILLSVACLISIVKLAIVTNDSVKVHCDGLLLKVPLLGPVLFKIKLARFSRCSSLMYASGISLIDTLKLGESVVDNLVLSRALQVIRRRIIEGEAVSNCFAGSSVFPPMFGRMLRVGESTGSMDIAFNQAAYFYDRESRDSIETLEQFIGPAMIIFVGAVMMWVVISVIGPIYDLVFSMSGQF